MEIQNINQETVLPNNITEFKKSKVIIVLAWIQVITLVIIILGSFIEIIFSDDYSFNPVLLLVLIGPIFGFIVIFTKKSLVYKISTIILIIYFMIQIFGFVKSFLYIKNSYGQDYQQTTEIPTIRRINDFFI